MTKLPDRESKSFKTRAAGIGKEGARDPLVIRGIRLGELRQYKPEDLEKLQIDERYQRGEKRQHVNQMVATLEAGGIIPDPIKVLERTDGSTWIVDGQQRWMAHWIAQKAIRAQLYHFEKGVTVDPDQVERALFTAFNNTVRLNPSVRAKSWPGASSKLLHYLNDSPDSPIRTQLGFGAGGRYPASPLLPCLVSAVGGATGHMTGGARVEESLTSLDLAIRNCRDYEVLQRKAILFAMVLRNTFEGRQRIHWQAARALGIVCGRKWKDQDPYTPSTGEMHRLAQANWEAHAPNHRQEIIPLLVAEVERRWKS